MQIASLHTPLNRSSRKVESAFLLTNTHRMMPSLFQSLKTFLWVWRLVPVPSPFCRDNGTHRAAVPALHQIYSTSKHSFGSYLTSLAMLGLPCTCHRGCTNRQSYKGWIYFWKEWGLEHGFSSKATPIVWIRSLSSSSSLQSLPHSHREYKPQMQERRQWWPPLEIKQWERARVTSQIINPALNLLLLCSPDEKPQLWQPLFLDSFTGCKPPHLVQRMYFSDIWAADLRKVLPF